MTLFQVSLFNFSIRNFIFRAHLCNFLLVAAVWAPADEHTTKEGFGQIQQGN